MIKTNLILILSLFLILNFVLNQNQNPNQIRIQIENEDDETRNQNDFRKQEIKKDYEGYMKTKQEEEKERVKEEIKNGIKFKLIKKITNLNDEILLKLFISVQPNNTPTNHNPFISNINDSNYVQVIESDLDSFHPGWGSDDNTIWVISVVATDKTSLYFDEEFNKLALNSTFSKDHQNQNNNEQVSKEINKNGDEINSNEDDSFLFKKEIKFGRIDYMGKTDLILTKWLIFKCPLLIVITKRGKEIRFFKTGSVPPKAEVLGDFIREERWLHKPIWNSFFSKGNSGEWIAILMGKMFKGFHDVTDNIPGWLLMVASSMIGTSLMQWLHGLNSNPKTKTTIPTRTQNQNQATSNLKDLKSDDTINAQNASPELKKELAIAATHLAKINQENSNQITSPSNRTRKK